MSATLFHDSGAEAAMSDRKPKPDPPCEGESPLPKTGEWLADEPVGGGAMSIEGDLVYLKSDLEELRSRIEKLESFILKTLDRIVELERSRRDDPEAAR